MYDNFRVLSNGRAPIKRSVLYSPKHATAVVFRGEKAVLGLVEH